MIFAIFMIAAAVAATVFMWTFGGGIAAIAFAALLLLTYKAFTYQSGPTRRAKPEQLNAFQKPLADAREPHESHSRAGRRNRAYRKHLRRNLTG